MRAVASASLFFLLSACGPLLGSGTAATEVREVAPFDHIEVREGLIPVQITHGPQRVEISGDDNLLPVLLTDVIGRTLHIAPQSNVQLDPTVAASARVSVPSLEGLELRSGAQATATGIEVVRFAADLSGGARATLSGRVWELTALLSGDSHLDASQLVAEHVTVTVSGIGTAQVCAHQTLDATVHGAGELRYGCDPQIITRTVTGGGRITSARPPD